MTKRPRTLCTSLSMAVLVGPSTLLAQEIVEVTGQDRLIEPDFEDVYRVGVLDGESWEMFGEVNHVAFDATGNLYAFDGNMGLMGSGSLRVLVFDAAGRFVREFGSSGGGPGEFNRPAGFAVFRDGTTVVSDVGHRAYQLFDASGAFQRMVRAGNDPGGVEGLSGSLQPDPRGVAVFTGDFGEGLSFSIRSFGGGAQGLLRLPGQSCGSDSATMSFRRIR